MKHKAKKSLGQNFLKSGLALDKIIDAGEIKKSDLILEIGPGKGALTERLLGSRCKVLAVEKDKELYELLKKRFIKEISSGQLNLVCGDILKLEIKNYELRNYKIIANIPYNITGAILKKFLAAKYQPTSMVLMLQQEVAKRIIARDGKESLLSISVKAYGTPTLVMKVPARSFAPKPKVDSAIVAIGDISRKFFTENKIDEEKFWQIVKAGFAHKRKKLSSNLKEQCQRDTLTLFGNKRAEDLALHEWVGLARNMEGGIIRAL